MEKFLKYILIIFTIILTGCGENNDERIILDPPDFYINEEGRLLFESFNGFNTYEAIIDGESMMISFDSDVVLENGQTIKIRTISPDDTLYVSSEFSEEKIYNSSEYNDIPQLEVPNFSFNKKGKVVIDKQEGVTSYGVVINWKSEIIVDLETEIFVNNKDRVKIRAISNSPDYLDSDYSEQKIFQYEDFGIKQLDTPKLLMNKDYEVYFNEHANTTVFSISINNGSEQKVKVHEKVQVKIGDVVKIKAISEEENYADSSYLTYTIEKVKIYSVPRLYYDYQLKRFTYSYRYGDDPEAFFASNKIWLKINDEEQIETTLTEMNSMSFNMGDKLSIRFKTEFSLCWLENEEWSDVLVYCNLDDLHYLELSNNENKFSDPVDNGDGTYTFTATSSNGEKIKLLIEGEVKKSESGWAILSPNTKIRLLNNLDGIIAWKDLGNISPNNFIVQFGVNLANEKEVKNYGHITFGGCPSYVENRSVRYIYEIKNYNLNQVELFNSGSSSVETGGIKIWYSDVATVVTDLEWNYPFFTTYIPGEKYSLTKEKNPFEYYLILNTYNSFTCVTYDHMYTECYVVGNIKELDGTLVSRENRRVKLGDTIEISVGAYSEFMTLVSDVSIGKETLHELLPFVTPEAKGTINNLVIPLAFSDHMDRKTNQNMELIYKMLGNIIDNTGKVTTYSPGVEGVYSLSEYFEIASYNQLKINSFVTDWYDLGMNFSENKGRSLGDYDGIMAEILKWVLDTYPELNMSIFDKDGNALYDSIIFISTVDLEGMNGYNRTGFSGAYHWRESYLNDYSGTLEAPGVNTYISIHLGFFYDDLEIDDGLTGLNNSTLIHEYGHTLGLSDYYDTNGDLRAMGRYDMQDSNCGDWNPFSKYSVGWIEPIVIDEDDFNGTNSIDIKIESFTETGDTILIPAIKYDYKGTPFEEYIMLELFTPSGLHQYDSVKYGLNKTIGVKMYHINAIHEKRILENKNGESYEIGTLHYSNSTTTISKEYGHFEIEVIQAGKTNTFTGEEKFGDQIDDDDFFKQGDVFQMEEYKEFFYNGLMDNGLEFGYTITIKEINTTSENPYAVITISK